MSVPACDRPAGELGLHEWFPTPAWVVHRLLDALYLGAKKRAFPATVLDPCAGDGSIRAAVDSWEHGRLEVLGWEEIDLNPRRGNIRQADYLRAGGFAGFDLCVMNPPFSKAVEFAHKARREARMVCMLHRLSWLASASRREFLTARPPAIYVLPNRPDFSGQGGASDEYAWFVWGNGCHGRWQLLDLTPAAERRTGIAGGDDRQLSLPGT